MNLPKEALDVRGMVAIKNQLYIIKMEGINIYTATRKQSIRCRLGFKPCNNFCAHEGNIYTTYETFGATFGRQILVVLEQVSNEWRWRDMASFKSKRSRSALVSFCGFLYAIE